MKIWIESKGGKGFGKTAWKHGFRLDRKNPDFIISYGGDGTVLIAEYKYPGLPKVPVKNSKICSVCSVYGSHSLEAALVKLKLGKYTMKKIEKVEAVFRGQKVTGLNEIQIRNKDPRTAIRFSVSCGDSKLKDIIGDGIIASTAHGSTAYYRALGCKSFVNGVRIGFNNVYPIQKPIEVAGEAMIKITRGTAVLLADNQKKILTVKQGETVSIRKSKEVARFVKFDF